MICPICGREATDEHGFCAKHRALWLQYVSSMTWRHSSRESVRAYFIKWQRGAKS